MYEMEMQVRTNDVEEKYGFDGVRALCLYSTDLGASIVNSSSQHCDFLDNGGYDISTIATSVVMDENREKALMVTTFNYSSEEKLLTMNMKVDNSIEKSDILDTFFRDSNNYTYTKDEFGHWKV